MCENLPQKTADIEAIAPHLQKCLTQQRNPHFLI